MTLSERAECVFQWRAGPRDRFDAGILRPDGTARPALDVLRRQVELLAPAAPTPSAGPAGATVPPRPRPLRAAVPGRLRVRGTGGARLDVRCPRSKRPRSCTGIVWFEDARYGDALLVNGRPATDVLRPRPLRFALRAGGHGALRFRVPGAVVERALAVRALRVRLAVTTADEPFALLGRYRVTARPRRARG